MGVYKLAWLRLVILVLLVTFFWLIALGLLLDSKILAVGGLAVLTAISGLSTYYVLTKET